MTGVRHRFEPAGRRRRPRATRPALEGLERRLAPSGPGDGLPEVGYAVTQDWGTGQQAQITITNDEAVTFRGWSLAFDYPRAIQDLWGAALVARAGSRYKLGDAGYNAAIAPGQVVTIGFVAGPGQATDRATNFAFAGADAPAPSPGAVAVRFAVTNDWGSGFQAGLTITNGGTVPVRDWTLEFDFPNAINSIWNASISRRTGNHYVLRGADHNRDIPAGGIVAIGLTGGPGNVQGTPIGYVLNGVALGGAPTAPALSIGDVTVTEGDAGDVAARGRS